MNEIRHPVRERKEYRGLILVNLTLIIHNLAFGNLSADLLKAVGLCLQITVKDKYEHIPVIVVET